ncbi:hypothetical protein [Actinomadura rudentiformis]|nr:hypothetical protein [Actinomadura rudentiformis]
MSTPLPSATAPPASRPLREVARPFVADGPSGVSIRDRLKGLTP